jgi:hypothetical protein
MHFESVKYCKEISYHWQNVFRDAYLYLITKKKINIRQRLYLNDEQKIKRLTLHKLYNKFQIIYGFLLNKNSYVRVFCIYGYCLFW